MENQYRGFYTKTSEMLANMKQVNILAAKDGLYEVRKNEIGMFCAKTNYVREFDTISEGFKLSLPKKIPFNILSQIIALFKELGYIENGKEVFAQIFWDRTKQEYFIHIPTQLVQRAEVNIVQDFKLNQNHLLVMEIHSHNYMEAEFSPHDNEEQKEFIIYGVIGRIDKFLPDMSVRIFCGNKHVNIKSELVFENPFKDYPEEWVNNITVEVKDNVAI